MPDLALSNEDFSTLRGLRIEAIVHSAAVVDHSRPYDALRSTNVLAASCLIDLVTSLQVQPLPPPLFIMVSTMSVIPVASAAEALRWTEVAESLVPPACATALESGYAQSKLISEHRLAASASQGRIRLLIARLGLIGAPSTDALYKEPGGTCSGHAGRRDWLSLLLCAVESTGASPAGLCSGNRGVAVLPVDVVAGALAEEAAKAGSCMNVEDEPYRIMHLDAMAFGLQPRLLSSLLDEIEMARGSEMPTLRRELPYPDWRRLVAGAGPPAILALAMLPPEGKGGALRLPSGARRRLRDRSRLAETSEKQAISESASDGEIGEHAVERDTGQHL